MPKQRVIVCAAIRNELTNKIICGPRHFDMVMRGQIADKRHCLIMEQGFVDQFGVFLTREEAWEIANEAGQIKYRVGGDHNKLFSENLY